VWTSYSYSYQGDAAAQSWLAEAFFSVIAQQLRPVVHTRLMRTKQLEFLS